MFVVPTKWCKCKQDFNFWYNKVIGNIFENQNIVWLIFMKEQQNKCCIMWKKVVSKWCHWHKKRTLGLSSAWIWEKLWHRHKIWWKMQTEISVCAGHPFLNGTRDFLKVWNHLKMIPIVIARLISKRIWDWVSDLPSKVSVSYGSVWSTAKKQLNMTKEHACLVPR